MQNFHQMNFPLSLVRCAVKLLEKTIEQLGVLNSKEVKIRLQVAVDELERSMERSYSSVLEMVKDLSGKKFARRVKKLIEKKSVFVYRYDENLLVFSTFKSAKKHLKGMHNVSGKIVWDKTDKDNGQWQFGQSTIIRCSLN